MSGQWVEICSRNVGTLPSGTEEWLMHVSWIEVVPVLKGSCGQAPLSILLAKEAQAKGSIS